MAEQQQREIKWATDREAKRTREELNEHAVEIRSLKEQLQAKNRECDLLKNQLEDVGKTNAVALENRRNEDLAKVKFLNSHFYQLDNSSRLFLRSCEDFHLKLGFSRIVASFAIFYSFQSHLTLR